VFRTSLGDSRLAALFARGTLLVPIPRSTPWDGEALWPALELAVALRDVGLALPVWTGLQREFGVQKSATAPNGRRPSVEQHYESFSVASSTAPLHRLLLVDDIITKGRTLLAAAARLQAEMPHADIRAFALVRTQGFVWRMDQVTDVCHGVVRWAGGDARREP
jgi:predicted amidophosphoribosyltransferase